MWELIAEYCEFSIEMVRTPEKPRLKLQNMEREMQIFLATKIVFGNRRRGMNTVDCDAFTMKLYCTQAGRNCKNGNEVFFKPFSYFEAADSLSDHTKYGEASAQASRAMRGSALGAMPAD